MSKSHAEKFSAQFAEELPDSLLERYIPTELLAQNDHSQTFLLKEKHGDRQYVAKRYTHPSGTEESLFEGLSHKGLAAFIERILSEAHVYEIRDYVPGVPLGAYAINRLPEAEAVHIAAKLCDILAYLHSQNPPVIHRDIKPSNIIIDPQTKEVTLIDFGIARHYDKDAQNDTVSLGTHCFAPPEQYGFAQTDSRADIYALGVVLCWLLTGECDVAQSEIRSPSLRRIIKRCTAFDPAKRYFKASQIKRALKRRRLTDKKATIAVVFICALLLFSGGYWIGRYTRADIPVISSLFEPSQAIVFDDAVLEQRVRENMGKMEGIITRAEAQDVLRLDLSASAPDVREEQRIKSIDALAYFSNLRALDLSWNSVGDIRPLAALSSLETLYLNGNGSIGDFTALESLTNMKDIMFVGCLINNGNVKACAKMTALESFWVESRQLTDISIVTHFPKLKKLMLKGCQIDDLSPVASLSELTTINLEHMPVSDLSPLLGIKSLSFALFSEDMRAQAQAQLDGALFDIQFVQ